MLNLLTDIVEGRGNYETPELLEKLAETVKVDPLRAWKDGSQSGTVHTEIFQR